MTTNNQQEHWAERYSRQIMLKEIGGHGQKRLEQATIGVVGAGTVGMNTLLYLAAAGIGRIFLTDDAPIQTPGIHPLSAINHPKVESATAWLQGLNPSIQITPQCLRLTPDNLLSWMQPLDLIIDCAQAHQLLNPMAFQLKKPLLTTWITDNSQSWITGSKATPTESWPCLACDLSADIPPQSTPPPPWAGLLQGHAGTLLATEAIKFLLQANSIDIWNNHLGFNASHSDYHYRPITKNPHCLICASPKQTNQDDQMHPLSPPPPNHAEAFIDITQEQCPMTFVRVKLKLEAMAPGEVLHVRLNGGEPLVNVPRTLADEGYMVSPPWSEAGVYLLLVTKPNLTK